MRLSIVQRGQPAKRVYAVEKEHTLMRSGETRIEIQNPTPALIGRVAHLTAEEQYADPDRRILPHSIAMK